MTTQLPNTIAGLRRLLQRGDLSARDSLRLQVEQFTARKKVTHAVTQALNVDFSSIDQTKPLSGIALAHKDIFDLKDRLPGLGRDRGSEHAGVLPAAAIQTLEDAGAVNLGALTMAEDACAATGQTANLPASVNPIDPALAVGGSSSGSAVAVASGMVYASLGTDTAGSVRIPAMTCGVMGLKTTHGLIDRQGMTLLAPSLDSIGVLARNVQDLGAVMRVLAPQLAWDVGALRTGYWCDGAQMSDSVGQVVRSVMRRFGQLSLDISSHEQRASVLQQLVMAYEVGQSHRARIAEQTACQQVVSLGTFGLSIPEPWWSQALSRRASYLTDFMAQAFKQVDVLLAVLQVESLPGVDEVYLGESNFKAAKLLALHRYSGWVNYLGLPSLAMPVGVDDLGRTVSIQLVGKPFHEPQLLAVGAQIQQEIHGEQGIMPVLNR